MNSFCFNFKACYPLSWINSLKQSGMHIVPLMIQFTMFHDHRNNMILCFDSNICNDALSPYPSPSFIVVHSPFANVLDTYLDMSQVLNIERGERGSSPPI